MFRISSLLTATMAAAIGLSGLPGLASAQSSEVDMVTITGQVSYRQRIALPPGSVATVTLSEVSRADAPATVIAETSVADRQVPIPFGLEVAPDRFDSQGRYALRAAIRDAQGRLRWTTDTHVPVDPDRGRIDLGTLDLVQVAEQRPVSAAFSCGDTAVLARFDGDSLALSVDGTEHQLSRVAAASGAKYQSADGSVTFWEKGASAMLETGGEAPADCTRIEGMAALLVGPEWLVEDLNGAGVIDTAQTTLAFGAGGTISGRGGCNRFSGGFELAGATLTVGPLAATQMACPEAVSRQELTFFKALSGPLEVSLSDTGALILTGADGTSITARR